MRFASIPVAALAALLAFGPGVLAAEDAAPASPAAPDAAAPAAAPEAATTASTKAVPSGPQPDDLTPEERAEKEARKACKVELCSVIASKDPNGPDISCNVVKTWREKAITKMLGGRVEWTWGKAVCTSRLVVERQALARAMSEPKYELSLPEQKAHCKLEQKGEGEPYAVDIALAPEVVFENGKAVEARLNWGEASAPMLIYALIYAATGLDNQTNVLGPEVVNMVNGFTTKKCADVKNELLIKTGD
jgi:hypothetical protein